MPLPQRPINDQTNELERNRNWYPNNRRLQRGQLDIPKERRTAIKRIQQQYYNKDRIFNGAFEANWNSYLADYLDNCAHWDDPDEDKVLFFRYSLTDSLDARLYYDNPVAKCRGKTELKWKHLCDSFSCRFLSLTKLTEI